MSLRTSVAVLAIAAVVLVAVAGLAPVVAVCAVVGLLFAPAAARLVRRIVAVCDEQPLALRALVSFRAPPRAAFA